MPSLQSRISAAVEAAFVEMTGRSLVGKSCSPRFRKAVAAACRAFSPEDFEGVDDVEAAQLALDEYDRDGGTSLEELKSELGI